jgi:ribonuclease BN (tRNA processing enzyme)
MHAKPSDHITLKIIGCGDAFASGGRFNTCFYLQGDGQHLLVDCGASSLVALKKEAVPLPKITSILLSHLHGDHFGGLPFFILDSIHLQKRKDVLNVIGPVGTEHKTKELTALMYPGTDLDSLDFEIKFLEYQSYEQVNLNGMVIQAFPVMHSEESRPHGLRITIGGKIFAFSGDTQWTDTLIDLSKDADLFICECNFYHDNGPNHLDYQTLISKHHLFSCKKILLNHLGEEMLDRCSILELHCTNDGQEITL